jgi:hypothetical protein
MLDEDEFRRALSLRGSGGGGIWTAQFEPVLAEYARLTGSVETNINAFYH